MYTYYAMTSLKIPCPWKKFVTTSQIIQFVIDLFVVFFASESCRPSDVASTLCAHSFPPHKGYNHVASTYFPAVLPHMGTCAGEEYAAVAGCGVLSSYLLLFIACESGFGDTCSVASRMLTP